MTAIEQAGRGDKDAALSSWHQAQLLVPALALADLTTFGEAGDLLSQHRRSPSDMPAAFWKLPATARRAAEPVTSPQR